MDISKTEILDRKKRKPVEIAVANASNDTLKPGSSLYTQLWQRGFLPSQVLSSHSNIFLKCLK